MANRCGCLQGSFDATVRLWDCKSQSTKPIQVLDDSKDSVSSLHVLGHEIVTGSVDGRIRLYDLRMGMMSADTIGRKHILQFHSELSSWNAKARRPLALQIPLHPYSRQATATRSWSLRLTLSFG